jgi:hypothetical protein
MCVYYCVIMRFMYDPDIRQNPLLFKLLMKRFISSDSNLDPEKSLLCVDLMSGLSNVGTACLIEGFDYIGVENNKELADAAVDNLLKRYCDDIVKINPIQMVENQLNAIDFYSLINPHLKGSTSNTVNVSLVPFQTNVYRCMECGVEEIGLSWSAQFDKSDRYYCFIQCRRHHELLVALASRALISSSNSGHNQCNAPASVDETNSSSSSSANDEVVTECSKEDEHHLEGQSQSGRKRQSNCLESDSQTNGSEPKSFDERQQIYTLTASFPGYLLTIPPGLDPEVTDWKTNLSLWPIPIARPETNAAIICQSKHWGGKIEVKKSG